VTRTLLVSGAVATVMAVLGMLLVLVGPFREPRLEADLEEQGIGPSGLRRELRVRWGLACLLGIWPGLVIALLLDRLTVATIGAYESGTSHPPLITVVPVGQLVLLGVGLTAVCLVCGWVTSQALWPGRPGRGRPTSAPRRPRMDEIVREPVV
jgi:hypothetical protein